MAVDPAESTGHGTHLRRPGRRYRRLAPRWSRFQKLAERGVEIFFTQVFRDNFFHADMHPGNIFVQLPDKYLAVDFGIVGSLSDSDQRYLAENFLAFFNHDYRKVAKMHIESGWVPPTTRIEEFRLRSGRYANRSSKTVEGHFLRPAIAAPVPDRTPLRHGGSAAIGTAAKTLLNIEGLGRQLYPELDLWQTAKPFLENWFKQRVGPEKKIKELLGKFPEISEQLPEIPGLVFNALQSAAHMQQQLQHQQKKWCNCANNSSAITPAPCAPSSARRC